MRTRRRRCAAGAGGVSVAQARFTPAVEAPQTRALLRAESQPTRRCSEVAGVADIAAASRTGEIAHISSPANGMVIALDPDIPPAFQRVPITANGVSAGMVFKLNEPSSGRPTAACCGHRSAGSHLLALEDLVGSHAGPRSLHRAIASPLSPRRRRSSRVRSRRRRHTPTRANLAARHAATSSAPARSRRNAYRPSIRFARRVVHEPGEHIHLDSPLGWPANGTKITFVAAARLAIPRTVLADEHALLERRGQSIPLSSRRAPAKRCADRARNPARVPTALCPAASVSLARRRAWP